MFIIINEDLLDKLTEHKDDMVVIYYDCPECGDEQVTYEEYGEVWIEQLTTYGYLVLNLDCTDCGSVIHMLAKNRVNAIEVFP